MRALLKFRTGALAGRMVVVNPGEQVVIGRGANCSLQLPDGRMSRTHCSLQMTGRGLVLRDLQSTNGTVLNGADVTTAVVPEAGRVCIGTTVFEVAFDLAASHSEKQLPCSRKTPLPAGAGPDNHTETPAAEPVPEAPSDILAIDLSALDFFSSVRRVGRGPLGLLYRVHHDFMRRDLLLYVLSPEYQDDEGPASEFLAQGRLGVEYSHPNLLRIWEMGYLEDTVYATMRDVGPATLWDLVNQRGPMAPSAVSRLARQLLSGLQHLNHSQRAHTPLCPGNVVLGDDGQARIAAFELYFDEGPVRLPTAQWNLAFRPPEWRDGAAAGAAERCTVAADIFTGGALVHWALTGTAPSLPYAPPTGLALPDGLSWLLRRSLAILPEDRFSSHEAALSLLS